MLFCEKKLKKKVKKTKKIKKVKDKYTTGNKKNNEHKIECNQLFTRFAVKNIGLALILDAEDLRTTFWLNRRGFENITVPNPYIHNKIKKDPRITAVNMLIGEYMVITDKTYTAVWLDYCCSFDGNKEMKPQEDIKLLFKNKLLRDNSTLAVTFCFRKHTRVDYVGQDEDRIRTCIENEARLNGYNLVAQRRKPYTGMIFILYKVYKN